MTQPTSWHTLPVDDALARLDASLEGLSPAEATRRLERHGPNRLDIRRPAPAWTILVAQFRSVVVLLLVVATAVASAMGDAIDASAIAAVLVINAAIGFVTELRARRAMEALRRLEVPRATVIREGRRLEIDATELVPADVVEVESGKSVPADARLISAAELRVNEAPLTGESVPVEKRADTVLDEDTTLAERTNMIYQATVVVSGTGRAVVTATGNATELGKIGTLTSSVREERTPLEHRLDALGRRLVWVALAVAALVALLGLLRGQSWGLMLQTGIALAIAAVPEGLPAVATIALAVGVSRMARRRAIVRRLPSVETLGSVTTVGADKTGTLTAGEMTVTTIAADGREIAVTGSTYAPEGDFTIDGRPISPAEDTVIAELLRICSLANRAAVTRENGTWRSVGDPTEAALLVAARQAGIDRDRLRQQLPEAGEIPFSSERQWMATFHRAPDATLRAYVKGAPGRIIERSIRELGADGERPLDEAGRQRLLDTNQALAARGLRVLAVARAEVGDVTEEAARELTFVGFVGIADPPAPEVKETIRRLREGGIRTVMITGDQRLTAEAVARKLGIITDKEGAMDGRELATLDEASLAGRLAHTGVFNRVSPADKLRIVDALQRSGEIVAMLGDGVNDAPALRKADIGVAMGRRGTDVAKDAADIVLADDRFSTIAAAVEGGRVIFDNIRKFVFYLFSCNLAEVLVLLTASVMGLPQPLLPLQILWLNMVTDTFPALALAVEPAEPDLMRRPPRDPQEAILSRPFLARIAFYAVLIAAATLVAFTVALRGGDATRAGTVAFMTLALAQALHLGNARSTAAVLHPRHALSNPWALGSVVLVVALQALAMYSPSLARVLHVVPLDTSDWALVILAAAVPAVVGQAIKLARKRSARGT